MTINVAIVIDGFLKLRKAADAMKERHKLELQPLNEQRLKLENWLLDQLNKAGVDSLSAKGIGTAFKQSTTSVTSEDWTATLQWIKDNNAWEMLEHRVSKSAVQDYIEGHQEIPPGISVKTEIEVRIRKG